MHYDKSLIEAWGNRDYDHGAPRIIELCEDWLEQDTEIKRLRDLRRSECTEFARIAGVDDSRDTRIVLHDARVKMETLCNAAAAVEEEWAEIAEGSEEITIRTDCCLASLIGGLRLAIGIKAPPQADEAGDRADEAHERKGDR